MTRRRPPTSTLLLLLATLVVLTRAAGALADAAPAIAPTPQASPSAPETTTVPAPSSSEPTQTAITPTTTATQTPGSVETTTSTTGTTTVPAPEVRARHSQPPTVLSRPHGGGSVGQAPPKPQAASNAKPVAPSALTPPLPSTLGGSLSGLPSFFINSFSIPPFLLPIYQAAGAAYGIPWQVLAAINEVETDYGRDLNVSTAGAEGWMQFLPSTWGQYGVDVNNDGFQDPYNPADAIFAAARYLKAAAGDSDIRAAVFSYNHSQAYVNSVLLRARLLGGTPPQLLGAITGLTEARFPVYAASHYSDGFPATEGASPHQVAGTTIYSQDGAPVIAVQDGRIVEIDQAGPFGRSITLRDAYGNTYTYAGLGALATLYPVLEARGFGLSGAGGPTGQALGGGAMASAANGAARMFRAGSENVYLHPLRVGVQVIVGTVLGHVGAGVQPHMVFQIRPAGASAPLIDPKPILDGWVKLQSSSAVKAKGRDPFATASPTAGQALLESKTQLEQQVLRDHGIRLAACARRLISDGRTDRRVLATLEFLSASSLKPSVSARTCAQPAAAARAIRSSGADAGDAVDISAINGLPVTGPGGSSASAGLAVHKLAGLQGVMKPLQIASAGRFAGVGHVVTLPAYAGVIHVAFTPLGGAKASAAGVSSTGLTPAQWLKLVARLGEVPDPTVNPKPSSAAIPDRGVGGATTASEGK